jgi:hypothetical protein
MVADETTADGLFPEAGAFLEQACQYPQLARTCLLHG